MLLPVPVSSNQEPAKAVRIGVLAKRGPQRCLEKWGPTADFLTGEISGCSFTIVPLGFDEIHTTVERAEVDFILANPSIYVGLERLHGASRILTLKNLRQGGVHTVYGGVIFCRADRKDIASLDDLAGKTFMAVEETSLGGWHAAWFDLKEYGIDPSRDFADLRFGGTHDAVVYAVRDGKVDAGTVRTDTLERMVQEGKIRLEGFRLVHKEHRDHAALPFLCSTRLYPEWPLAKAKHTSGALAEEVTAALLRLSPDTPVAWAARCAGWTIPHNYQPVHECLMTLRVSPYEDYGKVTLRDVLRQYWLWLLGAVMAVILIALFAADVVRLNRRLRETAAKQKKELVERKRAEKELRASEERYRSLTNDVLDTSAAGIFILDADFRVVWVNQALERYFGLRRDKILGKDKRRLIRERIKDRLEDPDTFVKTVLATYDDNTYAESFECHVLPDGELEERWLEHRSRPILSGLYTGGRIEHYYDITERKRAEEALWASVEFNSSLLTNAPNPIIVLDPDTSIKYVNPALERLTGFSAAELVGKKAPYPWWMIEMLRKSRKDLQEAFRKGTHRLEELFQKKSGERFWVEITSTPVMRDGEMSYYLASWVDITERRRAEKDRAALREQLHQAQKMEAVALLADGVAHDFNNLLTTIFGYTTHARTTLLEGHEALEALDRVEEAAEQAVGVTRSLLTFSRKSAAEKKPVELRGLVRSSIHLLRRVLPDSIEVVTDSADESPVWVIADNTQLQQVAMNLAINSRDAMPDGGILRITVSQTAPEGNDPIPMTDPKAPVVHLIVSDTGTGMSPDVQERIFEPFFTTKAEGQGTGLGLSIIHGIVKEHDGHIDVRSEVDRGTVFTITLPVLAREAVPETAPPATVAQRGRGELILLAEDDWHVRGVITTALQALGYEVLPAVDGPALLRGFAEHSARIRLLVIDVDLPKRSGLDCLREIRASGAAIPAIVITAHMAADVEDQLDEDAILLRKPFQLSELGALAGNMLNARRRSMEQGKHSAVSNQRSAKRRAPATEFRK